MRDPWIEKFKKEAAPKIAKEFKPEKIILFGSRVRGTAREDSDTPQEFKKIKNESFVIKDAMENSMEIAAA